MARCLLTTLILFLVSGYSLMHAQQIKSFSEEPEKFIEEVNLFMGTKLNEETQQVLNNFQHFWLSGVFSIEEQFRIIQVSNEFMVRKARAVPHFENYLSAVFQFKQISHDQASYDAWEAGLLSLIKDRRTQLTVVNRYLEISFWILSEKTLFKSSSVQWVATSDDFSFHYDSTILVRFNETDLICYAQRDSGTISKTSGIFNPVTVNWEGNSGKVNWIRAGFDEANVFAELSDYEINMTKSQYRADSVYFSNSHYFSEPLLGDLENKITRVTQPQRAIYPRFNSYTKRFEIKNIYDNVDFEGGLSMQGAKMNGFGSQMENTRLKF